MERLHLEKFQPERTFQNDEWPLSSQDMQPGAAFLDTVVDGIAVDSFAIVNSPISSDWQAAKEDREENDDVSSERLLRFRANPLCANGAEGLLPAIRKDYRA